MVTEENRTDFTFAPLKNTQLETIKELESKINMETGEEIILLAYRKKK